MRYTQAQVDTLKRLDNMRLYCEEKLFAVVPSVVTILAENPDKISFGVSPSALPNIYIGPKVLRISKHSIRLHD